MCLAGDPVPSESLARADRAGWRNGGPGQPDGFDAKEQRFLDTPGGRLRLIVTRKAFSDEEMRSCGVDLSGADESAIPEMGKLLQIDPAVTNPYAANFFAIREGSHWRQAAKADHAEIARAKAAGTFYSFMATRSPNRTVAMDIHFVPNAPASKG